MKKLSCILFLLFSFNHFTYDKKKKKSLGIVTGLNNSLNLDYQKDFGDDPLLKDSFFSPLAGFYYTNDLTNRLGVNLEVRYLAKKVTYNCQECRFIDAPNFPLRGKVRSSYFEVPVNLTINLNKNEAPSYRSYFILGYTYSRLLQIKRTDLSNGNTDLIEPLADQLNHHYINTGYELRHKLNENYIVAFNPYFRFHLKGNPDRHNVGFQLKFGRVL